MRNGRLDEQKRIAVYLALGSNVGDRKANLCNAIAQIRNLVLEVTSESSVYETEPVGFSKQRWFLNQVITVEIPAIQMPISETKVADDPGATERQAAAFLSKLLDIELKMGRERTIVNGPRAIDIDLLLYGDAIIGYSKDSMNHSKDSICHSKETIGTKDRIDHSKESIEHSNEKNAELLRKAEICVPHPRMHERRFVLEPLCEIAPTVIHPVLNKTCAQMLASLRDDSVVRLYASNSEV
jgi:7,8-dihydro-6-hydroxymethylpterin-pyrophosphokinase